MRVVAFDVGVSPSVALFGAMDAVEVGDAFGIARKSGKTTRTDPDVARILFALDMYEPDIVVVEDVGVMPKQGLSSSGRFMLAKGLLMGLALGRNKRLTLLRPQEWRKAWRMPAGKEQSRVVVSRLFPSLPGFEKKNSHNIADALLMATFVWHREQGLALPL